MGVTVVKSGKSFCLPASASSSLANLVLGEQAQNPSLIAVVTSLNIIIYLGYGI